MGALHGKKGKVGIGANTVGRLNGWSMDVDRDTKEVTEFTDSDLPFRSFIAGLVGASGKFDGFLDMTDTNGQFALWQSLTSDTPITAKLYLDDTHFFSVDFFITKFSPSVPIDDTETVSFDFQVTGAVAYS